MPHDKTPNAETLAAMDETEFLLRGNNRARLEASIAALDAGEGFAVELFDTEPTTGEEMAEFFHEPDLFQDLAEVLEMAVEELRSKPDVPFVTGATSDTEFSVQITVHRNDPAESEFVFETDDDDAAYEDDPWIEAAERRGFEKAKRAALEAVKQRHRSCSGYYDMDYGNAMRAALEEIEGIAFDGGETKPADERAALMAAMGGPAWFGGKS